MPQPSRSLTVGNTANRLCESASLTSLALDQSDIHCLVMAGVEPHLNTYRVPKTQCGGTSDERCLHLSGAVSMTRFRIGRSVRESPILGALHHAYR